MKRKFSYGFVVALSIIIFTNCKVSFTGPLRGNLEKQKLELNKIQYYNSKTIVLKRVVSSSETEVLSGTVTMQNGQMIEEIEIKKNTPGVLVKSTPNEMHVRFEPGDQKGNFLVFALAKNQKYTLLAKKNKVNYHEGVYRTTVAPPYSDLLIKKKSSGATTYKKRKAKGVKVN